jgi:hypothetical protein
MYVYGNLTNFNLIIIIAESQKENILSLKLT